MVRLTEKIPKDIYFSSMLFVSSCFVLSFQPHIQEKLVLADFPVLHMCNIEVFFLLLLAVVSLLLRADTLIVNQ